MSPHCDSMDGPVVRAAIILPFVSEEGELTEAKVRRRALRLKLLLTGTSSRRSQDPQGERGCSLYRTQTGGLGHGPVVPIAEKAIEDGSAEELVELWSSPLSPCGMD
jgi:hypothetical protein